jgi:vacuolar-type H+-ATPase subunit F/Vma7
VGLILITQELDREIRREAEEVRREGRPPLVLKISDLKGSLPEAEPLLERLRSLMGIRQVISAAL